MDIERDHESLQLIDRKELARLLALSPDAVATRLHRAPDQLPRPCRIGTSLRWRLSDVRRWLAERAAEAER